MSADVESFLNLFDSFWFQYELFTPKPQPCFSTVTTSRPLYYHHPAVKGVEEEGLQDPTVENQSLNRIPTLLRISSSDQFLSSKASSGSPTSVLGPQLQTILSGKEAFQGFQDSDNSQACQPVTAKADTGKHVGRKTNRRRKITSSRSLSELEFEELKGFMDLGFVFSDEDKNSKLVSIIPGLQRLGKLNVEESMPSGSSSPSTVARPYLSEAWDSLEENDHHRKRARNPMMDWRIPAFRNEVELKDHLRVWAHSVASTVAIS